MQWGVFAFLMLILIAAIESGNEGTQKKSSDLSQIVSQYGDVGIDDAKTAAYNDLQSQVQTVGADGPFADPAVASPAPACGDDANEACPFTRQVVVTYTGSVAAGGAANDTANNLNRYPTLGEAVVYASVVSSVYQATSGVRVAQSTATFTFHTMKVKPFVFDDATNNNTSVTEMTAEHDNQGCDPTNPTTCGQAGNSTPANTEIQNELKCVDDGNPNDGLCGPATPRPADDFQTLQTHSGNVGAE